MDAALGRRITAGCRAVGASGVACADLSGTGEPAVRTIRLPFDADRAGVRPPSLLWTADKQGAILFPETGYVLVAGTVPFMTAAVGEGIDTARARFGRHARALAHRCPSLAAVAAAHPPAHHAWSRPAEVEPHSAAARQLDLLDAFTRGAYGAADFARDWWEARRTSQASGERLRGPLGDLFDRVFMILEDYSVHPELAEPGDLSDDELRAAVTEVFTKRPSED
ncbi:hypothetical protein ACIP3A_39610 [Streptomyces tricolor]|uniref:hypothetical protein n=1 Tax=Streptomyces TaxID=1883 RepID=UPI0021C2DF71|nr:hypothetical protein [Streptomyces sp. PBH53]